MRIVNLYKKSQGRWNIVALCLAVFVMSNWCGLVVSTAYSGEKSDEEKKYTVSKENTPLKINLKADDEAPEITVVCPEGQTPEPVNDNAKETGLPMPSADGLLVEAYIFDAEAPPDGKPVTYQFRCVNKEAVGKSLSEE